jgi:hypothetical protein
MLMLQMGLPPRNYFVVRKDIINQTGPIDVTFVQLCSFGLVTIGAGLYEIIHCFIWLCAQNMKYFHFFLPY